MKWELMEGLQGSRITSLLVVTSSRKTLCNKAKNIIGIRFYDLRWGLRVLGVPATGK